MPLHLLSTSSVGRRFAGIYSVKSPLHHGTETKNHGGAIADMILLWAQWNVWCNGFERNIYPQIFSQPPTPLRPKRSNSDTRVTLPMLPLAE